jgi:uncharacterized protein YuzE
MEYDYDPDADILLLRLQDKDPDHGEQEGDVIMHYAEDGTLVELEILDASSNAVGMLRTMLARAEA